MDLCAIRYFTLLGLDIDNLRQKNAGSEHTNLTVEELMNEQLASVFYEPGVGLLVEVRPA
jgi:hypothetical protein